MSRIITFQPIDVPLIQDVVFPYIRGAGTLDSILATHESRPNAEDELRPLHDAYHAHLSGNDYYDRQWGRCDPAEFITDGLVRGVLSFAGHLHPTWSWNDLNSAYFLANEAVFLECFDMPISLLMPFAEEFPELADDLATIASAEETMGRIASPNNVPRLLSAMSASYRNRRVPQNSATSTTQCLKSRRLCHMPHNMAFPI